MTRECLLIAEEMIKWVRDVRYWRCIQSIDATLVPPSSSWSERRRAAFG